MKTIKKIFGSIYVILLITGCDPLDIENLTAITADDIWENPSVAEAYVNDIHAIFMPGDFLTPRWSDEVMDKVDSDLFSDYLKGIITEDSYNDFPYSHIRKINLFIEGIDEASFDEDIKNALKGQALFWRSWAYFRMVKAYGGVPLILEPASPSETEAIFVARSKTSECITQILKDLNDAISLVENKSSIGKIDKCVAKSFKGRVLLYWASPQFNRNNDVSRWNDAYNANKSALEFLNSQGKGLYSDYSELWTDEMNKEVIMVKRFQYPGFTNDWSQACIRPLNYSSGCVGANYPSLELVDAYPMKDGSKWDPDAMDYITFFQNRDQRFYASIAYNGSKPYIAPMFGTTNMWTYFYDADGDPGTGINGKEKSADRNSGAPYGGFYCAKMLDRTITTDNVRDGQVDWIEIRYAEVLMNMAEAANEAGKTDEALNALFQIRARAGIDAGVDGKYGITATTVDQIRQVIMDERFVEFAFEQKRFWDLRRWRIYSSTFNNYKDKHLHGLRIEYNGTAATRPTGLTDIDTIWDQFSVSIIESYLPTNVLSEDKYSFFGIPNSFIERNSKIEQNNTWGGTFDPLL